MRTFKERILGLSSRIGKRSDLKAHFDDRQNIVIIVFDDNTEMRAVVPLADVAAMNIDPLDLTEMNLRSKMAALKTERKTS